MNAVEVRRLDADDYEMALALARELAQWFRPLDQIALAIDLKQHEGLLAEREGALLGFLTYHMVSSSVAELSWLGVRPTCQGQGVGGALLAALEAELRARRVRTLLVSTLDASTDEPVFEGARRFYRRHGFEPIGRDTHYFAPGRHRLLLKKEIGA
ncbi:MAG: GNAT family N-acetyltransferase [Ardenticatenaceae bacterium]|nr:GNAT family N-acetyltransferase [Ardenticatenaceae bacterium]